jgi:hypothetical protein
MRQTYRYFVLSSIPGGNSISVFRIPESVISDYESDPSLVNAKEEIARLILKDMKIFLNQYPLFPAGIVDPCWYMDFTDDKIKITFGSECHGKHWGDDLFKASISAIYYHEDIGSEEDYLLNRLATITPERFGELIYHGEVDRTSKAISG